MFWLWIWSPFGSFQYPVYSYTWSSPDLSSLKGWTLAFEYSLKKSGKKRNKKIAGKYLCGPGA
jgi:hypothetical protein